MQILVASAATEPSTPEDTAEHQAPGNDVVRVPLLTLIHSSYRHGKYGALVTTARHPREDAFVEKAKHGPLRILFLSTGNAGRSQMAEAILRHLSQGRAIVASAGLKPASAVDPLAREAVRNVLNTKIDDVCPQSIEAVATSQFDVVFTLSDSVAENFPAFPNNPQRIDWNLADPAIARGTRDQRRSAFEKTARELLRRLRPWWRAHEPKHTESRVDKVSHLVRMTTSWRTFPDGDKPIVLVIYYGPVRSCKNMCAHFERSGFRVVCGANYGRAPDTLGFRPDAVLVRVDGPRIELNARPEFKRLRPLRARLTDTPIVVVTDHAPSIPERGLVTKLSVELLSRCSATSAHLVKVIEDRISQPRS